MVPKTAHLGRALTGAYVLAARWATKWAPAPTVVHRMDDRKREAKSARGGNGSPWNAASLERRERVFGLIVAGVNTVPLLAAAGVARGKLKKDLMRLVRDGRLVFVSPRRGPVPAVYGVPDRG